MPKRKNTKKHLQALIDALKSGKYKQGHSALALADGTFCCLGVACDVFRKATRKGSWMPAEQGIGDPIMLRKFNLGGVTFGGYPHEEVSRYFGITAVEGRMAKMNDTDKKSFKQIAAWLQRYILPKLED